MCDFRTKHKTNFIFCHININSYRHKFASMCDVLNRNIIDYLAISETKLDESFPHSQFHVQDYVLHRRDFTASSGGLLVYIRADLPHRRLVNIEGHTDGIECLCIEITIGKAKTVLTCLYKHPKVKHEIFANYFTNISDELLKSYDDFVFLGDLNCCPTKSNTVKGICDTYGLTNLIKDPTCHKGPSPTLLDVILVNNPRKYSGVFNVPCELSDVHNIIGAATRRFAPLLKPHTVYYRSYKNFNDEYFLNDISMSPFHVADIFDDVDVAWFTSALITNVIDNHAPVRSKTLKKQSVPYMNGALRKAIYARNMARNKFKKFGNSYWELNRKHRNNVVAIRKRSLSNYFAKNCTKHDKSFWNTISPFISDKKSRNGGNIILQDGDKIVADEISVSELFNEYFSSIASEIGFNENINSAEEAIENYSCHPSIIKIHDNVQSVDDFSFTTVTPDSVMLHLKNINPRKSTGFDNIPGKLIRLAHQELAAPITKVINGSMTQNVFPDLFKCAEVSPIFKKTDSLNRGNYRPVSVLTCLSKICETVYNDQLYDHFVNIFDKLLSAFRKGYSCQSLLIKMIDDWKTALDERKTIGTIFMDLSKAFDCLSHGLLVAKMRAYGLSLPSCKLVFSYLRNRRQRVKISQARSSWATLDKGVPQGSILGPLLFNVFVNDMFYFIKKCMLYNYADDNSLSAWRKTLDAVIADLTSDCKIAIQWYSDNGMKANPDKFQFMTLSANRTDDICIDVDETVRIKSERVVKVLGILIDENLKFSEHVSSSCKKAARQLNALARIAKYLDFNSRKLIYNSFIKSNFTYCPIVWHFCGKENNNKLEKIQERALRILYDDKCSSYTQLLDRAGTTTLLISRLKCMALEVFKCISKSNTVSLNNIFQLKDTEYSLRDAVKLIQPRRNCVKHGLRSFSYVGSKLWNDMPRHFKDALDDDDIQGFKSYLKHWSGPRDIDTFYYYL